MGRKKYKKTDFSKKKPIIKFNFFEKEISLAGLDLAIFLVLIILGYQVFQFMN